MIRTQSTRLSRGVVSLCNRLQFFLAASCIACLVTSCGILWKAITTHTQPDKSIFAFVAVVVFLTVVGGALREIARRIRQDP